MFTDLVGYTALSQKDEAGAMRMLEEHRHVVRPFFSRHGGVEVKTIGDAFLVEFASALEAVRCAYDIQQAMHDLYSSKPDGSRPQVRVGVHVGDVIHEQNDVYGDAVNVASRIEPLAQPGGICVSGQVYDHVRNKFEFPLQSLGKRELKNVAQLLEVYRVVLPWERQAESVSDLDRRRIAVLPFSNISPDPSDEYFADGMTEELIATMSRVGGLKVIARTSVMGYKGGQKKINEVAKELEVGSVLEGSVRKAGDRVRITVQLIDSKTSEHLWAESYERELKDVFAIQSEVSNTVAQALKVHLTPQEKVLIEKKQTGSPEAHTLYLKGRFYWNERTKENVEKALAFFQRAVVADPGFALAYSGISDCYHIMIDYGWADPASAAPLATQNALRAVELDESLAEAHASLAVTLTMEWKYSAAEKEYRRAIELMPNYSPAYHWYSLMISQLGRHKDAYQMETRALEIDPYSRSAGLGAAVSLYMMERYQEAVERLSDLAEAHPNYSGLPFWKSFVHVALGQFEDAVKEAERGVSLDGSANMEMNLAQIYALTGRKEEAMRAFENAKKKGYISLGQTGFTEILLGRLDEGYVHLEKGLEGKDYGILVGAHDPMVGAYLTDPRGRRLLERIRALTSET